MQDETTKTQQDVNTSDEQGGITPEETPTLTASQAKAMVDKARSDERAEVGRLKKAADEAYKIAQDVTRRLQERDEADLNREEEEAKDDPGKLTAIRIKRQAQREAAEAKVEKQRIEAERAEIQTERQEVQQIRAERLSDNFNVDVATLLEYGGGTKESMEKLAKSYGERKASSGDIRIKEPPDSGKTKGGASLTRADIAKMPPEERTARSKEIAAIPFG